MLSTMKVLVDNSFFQGIILKSDNKLCLQTILSTSIKKDIL